MATSEAHRVKLTIPAEYLEDARSASIAEVHEDTSRVYTDADTDERDSDMTILRRETQLLDQLLDATGQTTIEAVQDGTCDPIAEMLQTMIRQLSGRLERLCVYGPLPLAEILDIIERMRWAAAETVRVCPALDERTVA